MVQLHIVTTMFHLACCRHRARRDLGFDAGGIVDALAVGFNVKQSVFGKVLDSLARIGSAKVQRHMYPRPCACAC